MKIEFSEASQNHRVRIDGVVTDITNRDTTIIRVLRRLGVQVSRNWDADFSESAEITQSEWDSIQAAVQDIKCAERRAERNRNENRNPKTDKGH